MATVASNPLTAEQFYEFVHRPEKRDRSFELQRGEIVEISRPGKFHGLVCGNVSRLKGNYAASRSKGYVCTNDTGVVVERDPDTVRGPDLMLFDAAEPIVYVEVKFGAAQPLVDIVVLSPSDRLGKVNRQIQDQLRFGTRTVWLLDPDSRLGTMYRPGQSHHVLENTEELACEDILPGFACKVAEMFNLPGKR